MQNNLYKSDVGYAAHKKNHLTDEYNVMYDRKKTETITEQGRWMVVCTKHGTTNYNRTKKDAIAILSKPDHWCKQCRDLIKMEEAELILTLRTNRNTIDQLQRLAQFAIGNVEKSQLFEKLTGKMPEFFIKEV